MTGGVCTTLLPIGWDCQGVIGVARIDCSIESVCNRHDCCAQVRTGGLVGHPDHAWEQADTLSLHKARLDISWRPLCTCCRTDKGDESIEFLQGQGRQGISSSDKTGNEAEDLSSDKPAEVGEAGQEPNLREGLTNNVSATPELPNWSP